MNENRINEKIIEIVANMMEVPMDSVTMDSSPDTIETWDSLKHMNLLLALEQEFEIEFTDDQIVELLNVELIAATIKEITKGV